MKPLQTKVLCGVVFCLCVGCITAPFPVVRAVDKPSKEWSKKKRAEENFVKARVFEMAGNNRLALRFYEYAYDLDPTSQTLRDLLVEKYMVSNQYDQALLLVKGQRKNSELIDQDKRILADIYLRLGKYANVSQMLESIQNKRAEEHYTLGLLYESQGSLAKAANEYSGYLQKNPASLPMWIKTALIYTRLNRFSTAESLFVAMEGRFGQSPEILSGLGLVKLAKKDTTAALNSFKMAVLIDSGNSEALRTMAQIQIRRGQWAEAISGYEKLFANDSLGEVYGKTLSLLYYYNGQYAKASGLIGKLLADNIDDYELHFYCGLVYNAQDSTDLARMEFEKTVAINNSFTDAWQQLCFLALKEKNNERALDAALRFKKAQPQNPSAWRMEGYVLNAQGEYEKAASSLKKSLSLDSLDALTWFEMGSSLERIKNIDKAELAFKRVLLLKPNDPQAANYLGYMWAQQGIKLDSAEVLLKMALSQDSLNGAYLDSYAWILFKKGDINAALALIVKAVKLIDNDPIVFSHYGDILLKKGDASGALAAYKKGAGLTVGKSSQEDIVDLKNKINGLENAAPTPLNPSNVIPKK